MILFFMIFFWLRHSMQINSSRGLALVFMPVFGVLAFLIMVALSFILK